MSKVKVLVNDNMDANQALDSIKEIEPQDVLVLAYDKDGYLIVRSSKMCRKDALWMLEQAKFYTMDYP